MRVVEQPELLRVTEAARRFSVTYQMLSRAIARGRLNVAYYDDAAHPWLAPRDVERYLESRQRRGVAQPRTTPASEREQQSGPYYNPRTRSKSQVAAAKPHR